MFSENIKKSVKICENLWLNKNIFSKFGSTDTSFKIPLMMNFSYSAKTQELEACLSAFMDAHIYPNETTHTEEIKADDRWKPVQIIEDLQTEKEPKIKRRIVFDNDDEESPF